MQNLKKGFLTRGIAWLLAFVMVLTIVPFRAFAEDELEVSPPEAPSQVRDAAAPEDTSTSADAKNAVHGFVGVLVGGDINADLAKETGQRFKPIEGVKVYFQWYEAKGNRTSPTYYAVSGADGQFHIKVKSYIGRDRKLVKFDADTTVSAGDESYKMWVDESTIPEGYQLQYSTGEGVEFTDRSVAGGGYNLAPNTLVNYRVLLMKKQDEAKMHKEATPTGEQIYGGSIGQGAVRGKVSWDYESSGGIQWGIVSTPTSPAGGVTVTASYLSDYALKQIYSADTAKMLGLSKPSDIRGSGWTFKLETQLQEWIAKQVAKEKDKWIAETVSAVTNAEGDYKIQFKGTWGPHRNTSAVAEYTRESGKYYAGDAHKWTAEEVNRLGTVAGNAKDGSFLTGALDWNEKHVNSDWLFISTKDTDDVVKRTPWNYNWYTGSDNGWGIHGGWAQSAFGVSTVQAANSTRADFNLAPAEIKFNITNFDTQTNTAIPGDVAVTKTAGLPYKNTNDSFKIVWYDQDGKKIKEEKTQQPTSTGALAKATYDTTGVTETKTFIAKLHYVDSKGNLGPALAQDAFTVKIGRIVVSAYDDVNIANPAANDESMKGAAYLAEGLPEGLTIDKNTGTVSGNAKVPGKYTVTVTISILDEDSGETMEGTSNYPALVTDSPLEHGEVGVEYNKTVKPAEVEGYVFKNVTSKFIDGKAIEGLTITGDQITGTPKTEVAATQEGPNVEVTYDIYKLNSKGEEALIKKGHKDLVPLEITKAESQAPKYEPAYTDVEGTPGTEVTTKDPKFLDQKSEADPKPEAKPQPTGEKFALGDGAPQGATIDENTGKVTYTPTARDANTTVDIPVKVTYSDGTIDETLAKIKVGQAQSDSYQPEYTEVAGEPAKEATSTPAFKDADGQATAKPEGVEFTLGKDAPTGATVDKTTGEVKYTPSIDDAGTIVNIPVVATYKDGSTDEVKAPIKVAQGDNLNYEPEYKPVVAQVGHKVIIESPEFHDKDGNIADPKPAVTKYEFGKVAKEDGTEEDVRTGLAIDAKTGAITYKAVDADKNTVIEVPVIVTYADGSKESIKAKIDVQSDANFYDPKAKQLTTDQGIVPNAEDGVVIDNNPPEGTTYIWEAVPKVNTPGETTGTVKVTYPDGTVDFVEVPVTVTESASKKTTVDDTNIKTVDPTGQKQGTGIVVTNPDGTTVTAKDKNGNNVPAEINKVTGEIEVTPGTDATDPITVTVTDSDLDGGSKDIKVPVAEKSAQPEVAAPTAGDQTISGTGTPGARVNLALKGEKGSEDTPIANDVAVKEDGTWTADVPAGILLTENDAVVATQKEDGKSVSDPVEATVTEKAKTDAEKNPAVDPAKTEVANKDKLTDDEKAKVVEAVKKANPEAKDVTVDDKGNATLTYADGTTNEIPGEKTVTEKAKTDAEKNPAVDPAKTEVANKDKLTDDEKAKVVEAVKKANPEAKDVTVDDKGNATLTYADGTTNEIPGEKTVTEKAKTDAEKNPAVDPAKTEVANKDKLTDDEKAKVVEAVKKANPEAKDVTVDDKGNATLTYADGTTNEIPGEKTVTEKAKTDAEKNPAVDPAKTEVANKDKLTDDEKAKVVEAVKKANPEAKDVTVDDKGNATLTYADGTTNEIPGEKTVTEKAKTDAEKNPVVDPAKTEVANKDKLTDDEKAKVVEAVKKANPEAKDVTVDDKGNATLTYADGTTNEIPGEKTVTEKAKTDAEKNPVVDPATTEVANKDKLTDDEKAKVVEAVKKANPEAKDVTVDDKGNATLTYADGTTNEIPGEKTVTEKAKTDAEKNPAVDPAKTEVANKDKLTDDEKAKVVEAVKKANPEAKDVTVDDKGNATLTYADGTTNEIPGEKTVTEKAKTDAEKNPVVDPATTEVANKDKLTDDEKAKVVEAVKKANPEAKDVTVDDKGNATLTYADGTTNEIPGEKTVTEKAKTDAEKNPVVDPAKTEVANKDKLTDDEKAKVVEAVKKANPEAKDVTVDDKGNATLTYADGTTNEIPGEKTVTEKAKTDAEKNPVVDPATTEVANKDKLTDDEKAKVVEAVKKANPEAKDVTVDDKGNATLTYADGTTNEIPGEKTVTEKSKTDAEKNPVVDPATTEVANKDKLTDDEKAKVVEAVKKANPEAKDVTVDDKGNATLTYADGTTNEIPGEKTVTEKAKTDAEKNPAVDPATTEVANKDKLTDDEKAKVVEAVKKANPEAKDVTVDDKGNATLTYADGTTNEIPGEKTVTEKSKTDAEKNPVVDPAKTEVANKDKLTDDEKAKVVEAVKKANPEAKDVTVDDKGNATLTYADGTTNEIPGEKTVTEKAKTDAEKNPVVDPAKTEVANKDKLTDDEKAKVVEAVKKANPEAKDVTVDDKGNATLTYADGTTNEIPGEKTVTEKSKTDAEKNPVVDPAKTEVANKDKLTDDEKAKVVEAVKKANPEAKDVTVDDKGNATLTYADGTTNEIPGEKTVTEKSKTDAEKNPAVDPATTEVANKDKLTDDEKAKVVEAVKKANPEAKDVTVDDKGNATLTYADGTTNEIPGEKTVTEKSKTDAEKNPVVDPATTEVANKDKLTDDEKAKVVEAVKKANPEAKDVTVADDGKATLTYPDGTTNTLTPDQTVTEKVTKPDDKTTSVDDSKVKPVNPTDDAQDTGIIVKNKDGDTKISAKDEDGKDVPVEIDEDGKVIVTPGEDVDGPITVVIEDKDLPDGKVKVEVPVNGHEKGRDDNGNNSGKDDGGIWLKPVNPSDNNKVDDNKGGKDKHETAIHKLYIYGYKDDTFRPEGNMTRAEAAAMIARLKGLDMSNNARPNFSDVKSSWYNASINAVVSAGYMKGYPDGTFAPNGKITRAEFAQMIMAIDKANGAVVPFADVKGHWAEAAIAQAYGNGRIAGYPDNTFRPNNNITRAEAVTVLNKLFDRSVNENGLAAVRADIVPFVDVTANQWAYNEIVEASNTHEFYRTEQGKVDETWVKLLQTWKRALETR
ncbi:Parasporal protein [Aedoeadaptatus ivorii]|uniref:Parasporal protein n=1 Tax=Aedoeadaptatus ivorii TaxID=54006 RepID=A0A448V383_9FIRM|nr:Rib/alpha-like domain-containing protein [Peptoniphilus ivorii]VEJ36230.1 Parasporal protein [Peptoniphilus ivorii]